MNEFLGNLRESLEKEHQEHKERLQHIEIISDEIRRWLSDRASTDDAVAILCHAATKALADWFVTEGVKHETAQIQLFLKINQESFADLIDLHLTHSIRESSKRI